MKGLDAKFQVHWRCFTCVDLAAATAFVPMYRNLAVQTDGLGADLTCRFVYLSPRKSNAVFVTPGVGPVASLQPRETEPTRPRRLHVADRSLSSSGKKIGGMQKPTSQRVYRCYGELECQVLAKLAVFSLVSN